MSSNNVKILLCNIALRASYDPFPPVACTSLCNALIRAGYDPTFYDIDLNRPSPEQLEEYFTKGQFDIVGISAVASTGYRYTKDLSNIIKRVSPKTLTIVGGNLAASCVILLRKCPIEVCVIGEGEKVIVNLVKHYEKYGNFNPVNKDLYSIKGIAFIEPDGTCKITPEEVPLKGDEVEQPDYDMIARFSDIDKYMIDPLKRQDFNGDPRSHEPHRKGMKAGYLVTSKGCINKCTFCHRWIKHYKIIPVEKVISAIKRLKEKYNVGFFIIEVECFGEHMGWLEEFIEAVKPLNVLFGISGVRVSVVKKNRSVIRKLKEAGMVFMYFGIESGSDKILKIMEKNATTAQNLDALKACAEEGVYTTIQLVVGMPGESEQTINETTRFVINATSNLPYPPHMSITFLQSLPGSPTYENMRRHGLLGKTIDDEEAYLLHVSDKNASDFKHYINVSEEPVSKVRYWPTKIVALSTLHWLKNHGWKFPASHVTGNGTRLGSLSGTILYRIIDIFGECFWKAIAFRNRCLLYGAWRGMLMTIGLIKENDWMRPKSEAISLRKTVGLDPFDNMSHTEGTLACKNKAQES